MHLLWNKGPGRQATGGKTTQHVSTPNSLCKCSPLRRAHTHLHMCSDVPPSHCVGSRLQWRPLTSAALPGDQAVPAMICFVNLTCYGCFACMFVPPSECLVPTEAREHQMPGAGGTDDYELSCRCFLWKIRQCLSLQPDCVLLMERDEVFLPKLSLGLIMWDLKSIVQIPEHVITTRMLWETVITERCLRRGKMTWAAPGVEKTHYMKN